MGEFHPMVQYGGNRITHALCVEAFDRVLHGCRVELTLSRRIGRRYRNDSSGLNVADPGKVPMAV